MICANLVYFVLPINHLFRLWLYLAIFNLAHYVSLHLKNLPNLPFHDATLHY